MPSGPSGSLPQRLRALREEHWRDAPLTQSQLAKALSGDRSASSPLISAWENGTKTPPPSRIEAYATFFETDPPARVAIGVAALPKGAQVEIDAVVALPD